MYVGRESEREREKGREGEKERDRKVFLSLIFMTNIFFKSLSVALLYSLYDFIFVRRPIILQILTACSPYNKKNQPKH